MRPLYRENGVISTTSLTVIDAAGQVLATDTLKGVRYASTAWIAEGKPHGTIVIGGEALIRDTFDGSK